ncbi:MAG: hypothetical protein HC858_11955 [Brachymonas sp.]|nr:hypothetical protein [Brachymonas sp.]
MQTLMERIQSAASALQQPLRKQLSAEELDFLSDKVNPVIHTRIDYLHEGLASLRA